MNSKQLKTILDGVASGALSVNDAETQLKHFPFEDISFAHVDHHRSIRKGFPEVIFGQGKTAGQIIGIMRAMNTREEIILVTRIDREKATRVIEYFPDAQYHEQARILLLKSREPEITGIGEILVVSAGTSDIPVAEEAAITARAMGNQVTTVFDVGVAGIHRLFAHRQEIEQASVLVVVAGMEGALPSVVAGMVSAPVIAVPTSVGYGTGLGGFAALLGMLNSCSSNISVVNIDNGFGAGYMASAINHVGK